MADLLVWSCAVCNLPLADGAGYLTVDLNEAKLASSGAPSGNAIFVGVTSL